MVGILEKAPQDLVKEGLEREIPSVKGPGGRGQESVVRVLVVGMEGREETPGGWGRGRRGW